MNEMHLPWLELAILVPLFGAACGWRLQNPSLARRWAVVCCSLNLIVVVGGWLDFLTLDVSEATGPGNLPHWLTWPSLLLLDRFSAPLLALTVLLHLLTTMATHGAKVQRFSFHRTLVSQAVVLAALSTRNSWLIICLLSLETVFPFLELRARARPAGVFALHMALFIAFMIGGQTLLTISGGDARASHWGLILLFGAIFIRSGMAPAHCWMTHLFEHASFGTALLFVTPLMGAYSAVRLLLPVGGGQGIIHDIGWPSLATAVYAAGMALVQNDTRRFFCYTFLSHSALVLLGLGIGTPLGLTGALCVWFSVSLALSGLGLSLRALEARHRRLSLAAFHGLYEHTPALAVCFLLTGLASVGFPGTFGFWSHELLVDSAVETYPHLGIAVIFAALLSGVAVVKVYFLLFTGTRHVSSVPLEMGKRERVAVLILAALILGGGLFPQPAVFSRQKAATYLIDNARSRRAN
jgi:NADH-quinone oxidoreductase subunit M